MVTSRSIYLLFFLWILIPLSFSGCGEATLDKIDIYPDSDELLAGESTAFKAQALSNKGDEMPGLEFQWSLDRDIGVIDQSGRFKAITPGQGTITVSAQGITGTANVVVKRRQAEGKTGQPEMPEAEVVDSAIYNVIAIYNQSFREHKKVPVILSHKKHFTEHNILCTECHHDYKDGKNVWVKTDPVKSCDTCHDPEQDKEEVKKLQTAYHTNCKNCHKELVESGKSEDAPYKSCSGCHKERE